MIDEHCGRTFTRAEAAATRRFSVLGGTVFVDDIATDVGLAVSVVVDGDGVAERLLTPTEFRTWPLNAVAQGRPITALEDLAVTASGAGAVRVTAVYGWPTVPAQVHHAAFALALRLFSRIRGPFGVGGSPELGDEVKAWAEADVEAQLKHFMFRGPVVA